MSRNKVSIKNEITKELLPNKSYLVAVSGGIDSMALLYALNSVQRLLKIKISVAHVDHNLRKDSALDAELVKDFTKKFGIKFYKKKCKPKPKTANTEKWGRQQRYDFFKKILKQNRIDYVLTAHNANDVAETFLMRLIANKELKTIERFDKERKLIRPFLNVPRELIEEYALLNKIPYREDSTNKNQDFFRNKIRHDLLPYLKKNYDQRICEILCKRAAAIAEDNSLIQELLDKHISEIGKHAITSTKWLSNTKKILAGLDNSLKWRFVEKILKPKLGYNLGRSKSQQILGVFEGKTKRHQLSEGLIVTSEAGRLKLTKK